MYKYVGLDFDGTLLGGDHDISDRSVQILKKLQAKGVVVILCSGRNISQMNFVAEKIAVDNHDTFIVSDNGGVVTDINNGVRTTLRSAKFKREDFAALTNCVSGKTRTLIAFKDGKRYLDRYNIREMMRSFIRFREKSTVGLPDVASKVLLVDDQSKIEEIYLDLKTEILSQFPHLNVFRSVPTLIEITPEGSTKGRGLEMTFAKKGWDLNNLLVFGDGENDISMFKVAGHAVAMENAFDTVKEYADEICLKNTEDGVAQYLEEYYKELL